MSVARNNPQPETLTLSNETAAGESPASIPTHSSQFLYLTNTAAFLLSDTAGLLIAFLMAGAIRQLTLGSSVMPAWLLSTIPFWWMIAFISRLAPGWGMGAVEILRKLVIRLSFFFTLTGFILFATAESNTVSRLSMVMAWGCALVTVPFLRMAMRWTLSKLGIFGLPAVIYGDAEEVGQVLERLKIESGLGYRPVGVCSNDPTVRAPGLRIHRDFDTTQAYGEVAIIVQSENPKEDHRDLIDHALKAYSKVVVIPAIGNTPSVWVSPRDMGGRLGLEIHQHLFCPYSTRFKRVVDLTLVLLTAPFWMPVCGVIAGLIWLEDRSPAVYKQKRIGKAGEVFHTLKFRTMVPDAENVLKRHLESNAELRAEWEQHFKLRKDPRITKIGNILRKTSLDELPQLVNVLKGEMALVGPRPLPAYHYEQLPNMVQTHRERVRPGMTGLWQVSGRSDAGNEGMIRWDPYYVMNWSLWLDIVIIFRTARVVILGSGAR